MLNNLPDQLTPLHWHGDTFNLPDNAELLFSSKVCTNQAYIINNNLLGLQFHLEFNRETAERLATECKNEIRESETVESIQDAKTILSGDAKFTAAQENLFILLDDFVALNH